MYPTKRKKIVAKLLWFNPAQTAFVGRGKARRFAIYGKGYGMLRDEAGNDYFIYGNEIGGGSYGEDADKSFLRVGEEYVITSCWVTPKGYKPPPYHDFFMGTKARVKSIETKTGRKPKDSRYKKALKQRQICNENERNYNR